MMAPFKYIRPVEQHKMINSFIFHCICPRQEVGGATVEHLSLLVHLSSLSLCHPPLTMVAPGDRQLPKLRPFLPLRMSLPCDVHLLNLRTLEDAQVTPGITQKKFEFTYFRCCNSVAFRNKSDPTMFKI